MAAVTRSPVVLKLLGRVGHGACFGGSFLTTFVCTTTCGVGLAVCKVAQPARDKSTQVSVNVLISILKVPELGSGVRAHSGIFIDLMLLRVDQGVVVLGVLAKLGDRRFIDSVCRRSRPEVFEGIIAGDLSIVLGNPSYIGLVALVSPYPAST